MPVRPSVLLAVGLGAAHAGAAALLWSVHLPVPGQAALTLAIAASLVYFMARYAALHAATSIVEVEIRDDAVLAVLYRRGDWNDCAVLGSTFVSPKLTIVNLRPRGERWTRHLVLASDSMDESDFRRLRAWLRWKGNQGNETTGGAPPRIPMSTD